MSQKNIQEKSVKQPLLQQDIQNQNEKISNLEIQPEIQNNKEDNEELFNQILTRARNQGCNKFLFMIGFLGLAFSFYNNSLNGLLKLFFFAELEIDEYQYQLFIALPGILGIFTSFLGGYLTDKFGSANIFMIFGSLGVLGMWLCVVGGYYLIFMPILIGKTMFQISQSIVMGAQVPLLQRWYQGGDLTQKNGYFEGTIKSAFMVSSFSYPRLGAVNNDIFLPILVGAIICTVCYLLSLLAPLLEMKCQKILTKEKQQMGIYEMSNSYQQRQVSKCTYNQFKRFDLHYWVLVACFVLNFAIVGIWQSNYSTLIKDKFQLDAVNIGDVGMLQGLIGISSPILGTFMKKMNRQEYFIIFASGLSIFQYTYIYFHSYCETECFVSTIPISVSYGLYLSMFTLIMLPAIAMQAPSDIVGLAYGIAYGIKNLWDAFFPMITVAPLLQMYDPQYSILLLLGLSILVTFLNIIWGLQLRRKRNIKNQQDIKDQLKQQKLQQDE